MYAKDDGSSKQHWMLVPQGGVTPKPSKKKKPTTKKKQTYYVRVDTKTKGPGCPDWSQEAQEAYDQVAATTAGVPRKNVYSVCQAYIKKAARAAVTEEDLLISLFIKYPKADGTEGIRKVLVKAVNDGSFAEDVKDKGVTGFVPTKPAKKVPSCIIGLEKCKSLYGPKDLLPKADYSPTKGGDGEVKCTATQYLDSATKTCKACTTSCGAGKYIKTACSATADAVCDACTTSCGAGKYIKTACSATADAVCDACTTSCGAGKYIKTACSATADAVCDACTRTCSGVEVLDTSQCTGTTITDESVCIDPDMVLEIDTSPYTQTWFREQTISFGKNPPTCSST